MRHRWFSGAGLLLSLLLMALPCSMSMQLDSPNPGGQVVCSYFSLHPMLYGNWFPVLAGGFTVMALVFLLLRRDFRQMVPVCLILSIISQILSWFLFGAFSLIGTTAVLLQLSVLLQGARTAWTTRT